MGLFGGLKRKIERAAMGKIVAIVLKKIAEGELGEGPKNVYWFLAGKKTWIALVLAVGSFGFMKANELGLCARCSDWNGYLMGAAGFLVSIGLIDGALRTTPPEAPKP